MTQTLHRAPSTPAVLRPEAVTHALAFPLARLLTILNALPGHARPRVLIHARGVTVDWCAVPTHASPWVLATYLTVDEACEYVLSGRPPALRGTWDVTCRPVTPHDLGRAATLLSLIGPWSVVEIAPLGLTRRTVTGATSVHVEQVLPP